MPASNLFTPEGSTEPPGFTNIEPVDWSVTPPRAPQDQQREPEEPYGIPDWWDWETALRSPTGEELPPGAISWDPNGEAFYGNGLFGWLRGAAFRVIAPVGQGEESAIGKVFEATQQAQGALDSLTQETKINEEGEEVDRGVVEKALGFGGQGIGAITNLFMSLGQVEFGDTVEESAIGSVVAGTLRFGLRISGEVVGALFGGLQAVAEETEKVLFGATAGLSEIAEQSSLPGISELIDPKEGSWFYNFLDSAVDVISVPWNIIRALEAPVEGKGETLRANYEAGRIAYSTWVDPALKQEYIQRWRDGANPYLLSLELMNPIAELAGELFFDPLNWIGVFKKLFGSGDATRAGWVTKVEDGEVGKALNNLDSATDAEAAGKQVDLLNAVIKSKEEESIARKAFIEVDKLTTYTPAAKADAILQPAADAFQWIAATAKAKKPLTWVDDTNDAVGALAKMASGDAKLVEEGLLFLQGSGMPLNGLLSKGANDLGFAMWNMLNDGKGVLNAEKFLARIKKIGASSQVIADAIIAANKAENVGDSAKILEALFEAEKITDAAEIKRITELVKQVDKFADSKGLGAAEGFRRQLEIAELTNFAGEGMKKTLTTIIPSYATRVARGEKLSAPAKAFYWMERWKGSTGIRAVDSFFANVYMGFSPGYVIRNLLVDNLTILIDKGPGAFLKEGARMGTDFQAAKVIDLLGGVAPTALRQGIGSVGLKEITSIAPGLKYAARVEKASSVRIFLKSVTDTMRKMIGRDTMELGRLEGIIDDTEVIASLPGILRANNYDVAKLVEHLGEAAKTGEIDVFSELRFLTDDWLDKLDDFGLTEHVALLSQAETQEDIAKIMENVRQVYGEMSDVSGELVKIPPKYAEEIAALMDEGKPHVSNEMMQARHSQRGANILAETKLEKAMDDAASFAKRNNIPFDVNEVERIKQLRVSATERLRPVTQTAEANYLRAKAHRNLPGLWDDLKIPGTIPDDAKLAEQIIRDWIWEPYWDEMGRIWPVDRDLFADGVEAFVRDVRTKMQAKGFDMDNQMFRDAMEYLNKARDFDGTVVFRGNYYKIAPELQESVDFTRKLSAVNGLSLTQGEQVLFKALTEQSLLDAAGIPWTRADVGTIADIVPDDIIKILEARAVQEGRDFIPLAKPTTRVASDVGQAVERSQEVVDSVLTKINDIVPDIGAASGETSVFINQATFDANPELEALYKQLEDQGWTRRVESSGGRDPVVAIRSGDIPESAKAGTFVSPQDIPTITKRDEDVAKLLGITAEQARDKRLASLPKAADEAADVGRVSGGDIIADSEKLMPPHMDTDAMPSPQRHYFEQKPAVDEMLNMIEGAAEATWGRKTPFFMSAEGTEEVAKWADDLANRVADARLTAAAAGTEARHFALHNYSGKYNFDTAISMVMPYHFWHSRTYASWMRRIAINPGVVAGYAHYKEAMAQIHAGAPDWWKQNINSAELLGLFPDNPLFINLEATLNPMNGLTGVDFNDRHKRVNWWTSMLDDLGKFGPSTWTPLNLATAWALKAQGEEEAAARWGGRLIPQMQTVESIINIAEQGVDFGQVAEEGSVSDKILSALGLGEAAEGTLGFEGAGEGVYDRWDWLADDPAVSYFSNGIDPYTRRRVGRALGAMIQEGIVTPEQAMDAARTQTGQWWDAAHERAINNRAPGQLMSFFLGVGFKARTVEDLEIDRFDTQYFALWNRRSDMSNAEFQRSMANLREEFPFMDTVILSRKSGEARDSTYAYNVLARIPPGDSSISQMVGLDRRLINKFYEGKGNISEWEEADRLSFMAAVVNLGAVLQTPDDATRVQWDNASAQYQQWRTVAQRTFGEDIHDLIDAYYAARRESVEDGYDFLDDFPQVAEALDQRAILSINNPQSPYATYYGSITQVEAYYKGLMYDEVETELGEDIWDTVREWSTLLSSEKSAFKRANPDLIRYWDIRDAWTAEINRLVVSVGSLFEQPVPPGIRPDADPASIGQEDLLQGLQNQTLPLSPDQWAGIVGEQAVAAVRDNISGTPITREIASFLRNKADDLGMTGDQLIQLIGISLMRSGLTF